MSSFNGMIATATFNGSTVSQTLGATASYYAPIVSACPAKFFDRGLFSVVATGGVSGGFGVLIVGNIGGATAVIGGRTSITSVGGSIIGATGSVNYGFPRPSYVQFQPVAGVAGFTAQVFLAGEYL
jgi:hypothetical protein